MAEKRMFAMKIIDSDAYLNMPHSAQNLYFHLAMRADDDGFIDNPRKIMRIINASEDDIRVLLAKGFLLQFENSIIVIRHWWIHNYIKSDRHKPTLYSEEKGQLECDKDSKIYNKKESVPVLETEWKQNGNTLDTKRSIDKISIDKTSIDKTREEEYSVEPLQGNSDCDEFSNETSSPIFISLPKIGSPSSPSKIYHVTEEYLAKLEATYPAVDVRQQLREMKHWLEVNPTKKKVNVPAFVARWLAKDQDRGGNIESVPSKKASYKSESYEGSQDWRKKVVGGAK